MSEAKKIEILFEFILYAGLGLFLSVVALLTIMLVVYPAFMYLTLDNLPKDASKRKIGLMSVMGAIMLSDDEVSREISMAAIKSKDGVIRGVELKKWQKERIENYESGLCYPNGKKTFKGWLISRKTKTQ